MQFSELNRKAGRVMATWLIWRVRENARSGEHRGRLKTRDQPEGTGEESHLER